MYINEYICMWYVYIYVYEQHHPSEDLTTLLYRNRQRFLALMYELGIFVWTCFYMYVYIHRYMCIHIRIQQHPSEDLTTFVYRNR
jgi:hypothetical protein